ncbi:MAG TPA: hypothetical protein VKY65_18090 [Alphaproteobacteria bacterium]|nr:hypothetical protein [Alphaproteobacteria bacterium]
MPTAQDEHGDAIPIACDVTPVIIDFTVERVIAEVLPENERNRLPSSAGH